MGASRIKILLVDDDQDAYVLTRELLSESGSDRYELDWVPSYEDALQAVMHSRMNCTWSTITSEVVPASTCSATPLQSAARPQ